MRCVTVGVRPGFFSREHGCGVGEAFRGYETLERRKPMFVVMRAIIRLTAVGSGLQLFGESRSPLLPGEVPLLGQFNGECECLGLPRLREHGSAIIARKLRKRG